ncbi:MAG: hypothetical protein PPHERAN_6355, partial [uncultured Paraburkholderia sp.]
MAEGYKWAKTNQNRRGRDKGSCSSRYEEEVRMWKQIWALKVKEKLKHFIWRACHDRLPVASNIQKRGMKVDDICRQCEEASETVEHLFFQCRKSKTIWKVAPISWDGMMSYAESVKEWWIQHCKSRNCGEFQSRLELSLNLWWQIWKARNEWVFRGVRKSEVDIVRSATEEWMEYKDAADERKEKSQNRIIVEQPKHWEPLEMGVIKLNVSSVRDKGCQRVGLGGIARDGSRRIVHAWAVARD